MKNITLIVIPGPGARNLSLEDTATAANLICSENLHGRDIIVNGVGVSSQQLSQFIIPPNAEVFATGTVKGNLCAG